MVLKEKLQRIMNDPVLWIETFVQIPDKTGKVVPFKLNPQQKYLLRNMGKREYVISRMCRDFLTLCVSVSRHYYVFMGVCYVE